MSVVLKCLLGVASGSVLYLLSNSGTTPEDQRVALYLVGLGLMAMSLTGLLRAAWRVASSYLRTAVYLLRCRLGRSSDDTPGSSSWAPVDETQREFGLADGSEASQTSTVNA